jgi:hypothetical protein
VEDILHDQPLLGIEGQQFILGDIEEGSIKIGRIFGEIMTTLYMKLDRVQHFDISPIMSTPTVPPCSGSGW